MHLYGRYRFEFNVTRHSKIKESYPGDYANARASQAPAEWSQESRQLLQRLTAQIRTKNFV